MSRSGYSTEGEVLEYGRWRGVVASAIRGKRGQSFLRELASAMDAMPDKSLISGALVTPSGECCAMGVVCKSRGLNTDLLDEYDSREVGGAIGIAEQLAAEIANENDDLGDVDETPDQRWVRMRKWVADNLRAKEGL